MAYVSKEKKTKIVAAAKAVLPKDWKVTFSVENHSGIVATIHRAPKAVLKDYAPPESFNRDEEARPTVNEFHLGLFWKGKTLKNLQKLLAALNTDNFDNSDAMSDYFHVGHYVTIQFGRWDKQPEFV